MALLGLIAGIWWNARGRSLAMGRADERCEAVQWAVLMSGGTGDANFLRCMCQMDEGTSVRQQLIYKRHNIYVCAIR